MSVRCCGSELQVIRLSSDGPDRAGVSLHRCTGCGSRGYVRGGALLSPDEAFAALAGAFREPSSTPRRSPAPRDARAAQIAADRAERAQQRARAQQAQQVSEPTAPAAVDVTDLADLLSSWTVLGASR
jgi:hypothetical protein